MVKRVLVGALAISLMATAALADTSKMGTAGGQELRIPVGCRGTGMAGSVVADVTGPEALFWNPAGAAKTVGTEVSLSYRAHIADMTVSYFGLTSPFSFGTVGVSAKILSLGDLFVTTEDDWDGTGEVYSINIPVLGLTYSTMITDRVAFGATAMYLSEEVMDARARGMVFDAGFQYVPGWRALKIGIVMKSYGPRLNYSGPAFDQFVHVPGDDPEAANRNLALTSAQFELPSSFQVGGSYDLDMGENGKATLGGVFQSNNFSEDEYRFGAEYNMGGRLFVRAGYVFCTQEEYLFGPTLGFGAKFNLGRVSAEIDYSHTFISSYFDDIPELTMHFGL